MLDLIEDGPRRSRSSARPSRRSIGAGLYALAQPGLLVGRRHAGELHRGAPRPARRPHPLAAARPQPGRALDRRRRDGLARGRLRGPVPRRGGGGRRGGRTRRRRQLGGGRRADRRRRAAARRRSCRSGRSVGEAARRGGRRRRPACADRRRRPDRIGRRRRAGRLDCGGRRGCAGRAGFPGGAGGSADEPLRGDVRAGRPARRAAARGHAAGQAALGAPRRGPPRSATISALGGSAIGGSLAEALWRDSLRAPTVVNRAAALPGWVGPGHLVVPVSYSGATAETLAAARRRSGARRRRHRGDGGRSARRSSSSAGGGQVVRVPAGLPPRAALGSLFGALAAVLEHAGVTGPTGRRDIRAAAHACDAVAGDRGGGLASELGEAVATTHHVGLRPRPAVGRRAALQVPAERERQVRRRLRRAPRGRPQRDRRLGRRAPHRRSPRGHPPGRPRRPAHIRASIATTPRLIGGDATLHRVLTGRARPAPREPSGCSSLLDHASVYTARAAGVDPFEIDRIAELKQALARERV